MSARSWGLAVGGAALLVLWSAIPPARTAVSKVRDPAVGHRAEPAPGAHAAAPPVLPGRVPAAPVVSAPVVSAPAASAGEQASTLLAGVAARMRAALSALPDAAALQRCAPFTTPACTARLSAALYEVLDASVVPAIEQHALDLRRLERRDSALALAPIMKRLEQASDPVERVAALVLLERASQLEAGALPSSAFRGLADKTAIEAQLLLTYGQLAGLPDASAVREVAALAALPDADARVQSAALNALAQRSAPELIAAVHALRPAHAPGWSGWSELVAPALARCGMACADQSAELVAAAADPAELAARILRRCPPPERSDLLARLAPALPDPMLAEARQNAEL